MNAWWALVGCLTIAAFVLRLPGVGQGLALDEALTFDEIHGHPLGDLVDQMRAHGEDNPPLYYVLAWLAAQTGDDTVAIRLPSLILGAAAVPLVFMVGARTVGRAAGLLAALFLTVSPFALFYAAEARAYSTAIFFSALSTLILLIALEKRSGRWWAAYTLAATALLYTHYVGGFVLAAQGGWALLVHRSQLRSIVLANAAAAIAFLPWAATAEGGNFETVVGGPLKPTLASLEAVVAVFPGQPYSQILRPTLEDFPGVTALALVAAGVLVAIVGAIVIRPGGPPADATRATSPRAVGLLLALALASPIGVFVYAVAEHDIFLSRYFSPSLPAALLLVGWLLLRPPGVLRIAAIGLVTAGLLIGTGKAFEDRFRRPPLDDVANFIRAETGPGDPVVENPLPKLAFYTRPVRAYLDGERPFSYDGGSASEVWQRPTGQGRVAILTADLLILPFAPPRWGPGLCFERVAHRGFSGTVSPGVAIYGLDQTGRECLRSLPTFQRGFGPSEEDHLHQWRTLTAPSGRLVLTNTTRPMRTVGLSMTLDRPDAPAARVRIRYPGGDVDEVTVADRPAGVRKVLRIGPGRNRVTLSTEAEPIAAGAPPVYLRVVDLRLEPRSEPPAR